MIYVSKLKPWTHQQQALDKMRGHPAYALLMAMRCGKSSVLLDDFGEMEATGEIDDLLVIAPAGVYRTWLTAIDKHVGDSLRQRLLIHLWAATETGKAKLAEQAAFLAARDRPRILLVNAEACSTVKRARQLILDFVGQRRCMAAVDESVVIKAYDAKRAVFIVNKVAPLTAARRILSGLPNPRSPLDLYMQFRFLDPAILNEPSYFAFRARYAVMRDRPFGAGGRMIPVVVGYRSIDKLRELIAPYSFRVTLEDCYDLPPKMYERREVELTDEQRRIYNEIKKYATADLGARGHVTATQVVTQILRLHQVLCGHVGLEDGTSTEIPEKRTKALLDLLEEHDGKAIIWCSYDIDVRKVADAIARHFRPIPEQPPSPTNRAKVARFWGGNRPTREDEEKLFLNDPACRHIVATAAAGGRGRTWVNADLVVYYSNTPSLEHRSQSEERAQGIDKVNSVLYVDLVAPGTVDERMLALLRDRIELASAITGDDWKDWLK